jgi:hypothetical protein
MKQRLNQKQKDCLVWVSQPETKLVEPHWRTVQSLIEQGFIIILMENDCRYWAHRDCYLMLTDKGQSALETS